MPPVPGPLGLWAANQLWHLPVFPPLSVLLVTLSLELHSLQTSLLKERSGSCLWLWLS